MKRISNWNRIFRKYPGYRERRIFLAFFLAILCFYAGRWIYRMLHP